MKDHKLGHTDNFNFSSALLLSHVLALCGRFFFFYQGSTGLKKIQGEP